MCRSVVSWRVDTISKRKAARRHERGDKADDLVELFNCDLDKELQLEDEADANEPEAEDRTEMSPFSQPRLTTEELCHQCIEQLRYRGKLHAPSTQRPSTANVCAICRHYVFRCCCGRTGASRYRCAGSAP